MALGGKRPGAGRKKGNPAIIAERYRAYLIAQVDKNKEKLAKALLDKGLKGDIQALKELHDRAMGRPKEMIDITSSGKPIPILANVFSNHGDKKDSGVK